MKERINTKIEATSNWLEKLDKIQDSTRRNYFSVLPEESRMLEYFSDAFVINKPKGRVGGDGFWLHKYGQDVYLALFTCDGEGHLASMMTRIYMNALKKMIEEYDIDFTGSILQFLHREVQARFRDKDNILLNTNANVGIVKLDTITKEMEFAGANMDLIQVTPSEYKVIKGEDFQVGEKKETRNNFLSISLEDPKNSNFYLCSSGVFQLIGGPSFKKLSMDALGEFLFDRKKAKMDNQKKLVDEFLTNWTGANQQNDDILVIGFKE